MRATTGFTTATVPEPTLSVPLITSVSVIVPVYNEERTLDELLQRLVVASGSDWEIIVIDDGSTDGTAAILERWSEAPGIRILHHPVNGGKGSAVRTGLANATGKIVVIQDADLEYDPADLTALVDHFQYDEVQAVYGIRYGPHARLPWTRFRLAVSLLNGLVGLLYGRRLHDEATCYKVVRRELLTALDLRSERFELCAEITGKLCRLGIPIREVPISYHPRGYREGKKIRASAFFRCAWELIRWRFARRGTVGSPCGQLGDGKR